MSDAVTRQTPQLVYIGTKDNVFTHTLANGQVRQLTWSWEEKAEESAEQSPPAQLTHAWPAWAPDESRIACFGLRETKKSQMETVLYTIAADGIESWELADLSGGMPIYGNWSPRADTFAALVQHGERHLSLETVSLARPGKTTPLVSGAPLFWSWSPRGDQVVVHVRNSQQSPPTAQVLVLDARSGQVIRKVSNHPGEFRVPTWSPQDELLTYVEEDEHGRNTLFLFDVATGERAPVSTASGAMAALWSADGRFLACGEAARSGSSVFSSVKVLDLQSGRILPLLNETVAGFFWSPAGDALCYLSIDTQRSQLCWSRQLRESGEKTELARFLPSREQALVFSFFDQYALSHPPVAPDGSVLAFAGYVVGAEPPDATTSAQIYVLPLIGTAAPSPVAHGQFACWNLP
jgi:hypothetical protein